MPIHDWTRVRANRFHHFHQEWIGTLMRALNRGLLPAGYFASREQVTGGPLPHVVALELAPRPPSPPAGAATALLSTPPSVRHTTRVEEVRYARAADRVTICHPDGDVVAVIEIVSRGNKESKHGIEAFVKKVLAYLDAEIHVLVVDLHPPNPRNPQGIHKAIWDELRDEPFELPPDKRLMLASYAAGGGVNAYVEPVGVGDVLPDMPLYLTPTGYVRCPLEATYRATWDDFPAPYREPLEPRRDD